MLSRKCSFAQEVDLSCYQQFRSVGEASRCGVTRDIGVGWDKQAADRGWALAYQQPGCWCDALARHTQIAVDRKQHHTVLTDVACPPLFKSLTRAVARQACLEKLAIERRTHNSTVTIRLRASNLFWRPERHYISDSGNGTEERIEIVGVKKFSKGAHIMSAHIGSCATTVLTILHNAQEDSDLIPSTADV